MDSELSQLTENGITTSIEETEMQTLPTANTTSTDSDIDVATRELAAEFSSVDAMAIRDLLLSYSGNRARVREILELDRQWRAQEEKDYALTK